LRRRLIKVAISMPGDGRGHFIGKEEAKGLLEEGGRSWYIFAGWTGKANTLPNRFPKATF